MRNNNDLSPPLFDAASRETLSLVEQAVLTVPCEQSTRFCQAIRRAVGLRMFYEALDYGTACMYEWAEADHYLKALREAAILSCGDDLNPEQVLEVVTRHFERRLDVLHEMNC